MKESLKEAQQTVKMYQANDWEVTQETETYYLLKKNVASGAGHILVFIFFWWTLGFANLLYWALSNKSKKIIK